MTSEATEGQPRTFTLQVWSENVGEGVEHRGRAQDVRTGAFRTFRRGTERNAFLAEPGRSEEGA